MELIVTPTFSVVMEVQLHFIVVWCKKCIFPRAACTPVFGWKLINKDTLAQHCSCNQVAYFDISIPHLLFVPKASLDSTELTYSTKAQAGRQPQQDTPSSSKRLSGMNSQSTAFTPLCTITNMSALTIDNRKIAVLRTAAESVGLK